MRSRWPPCRLLGRSGSNHRAACGSPGSRSGLGEACRVRLGVNEIGRADPSPAARRGRGGRPLVSWAHRRERASRDPSRVHRPRSVSGVESAGRSRLGNGTALFRQGRKRSNVRRGRVERIDESWRDREGEGLHRRRNSHQKTSVHWSLAAPSGSEAGWSRPGLRDSYVDPRSRPCRPGGGVARATPQHSLGRTIRWRSQDGGTGRRRSSLSVPGGASGRFHDAGKSGGGAACSR